ncbi:glutaredoxin [Thermococcus sp.]|uniref:glutaredoxin n=1 Tax=Thermococcus sp. TaxID=35749 RepID=UPI0026050A17|nr:glutaredoxin [Thermococcus sp.]
MKKLAIVLLLVFLIGIASGCLGSNGGTTPTKSSQTGTTSTTTSVAKFVDVKGHRIYLDRIHFYMYGMKTCPHCRHMHEWIPQEFGKGALTYYELVDNETNQKLFSQVAQLTGITGVPAIAITYNGTLYAVIEGEFNVSATPEIIATAIQNNGTLLFVGKTYLLPYKDKKSRLVIDALYKLFVRHEPVDVQKILSELKSG